MIEQLHDLATNHQVQAAVVVVGSFFAAKAVEWCVVGALRYAARRMHTQLAERTIELARWPAFNTVLLVGLALAVRLIRAPDTVTFVALGALKTLGILIWLRFAVQAGMAALGWMSQHREYHVVQPVTLPLFELVAKVVLFGTAIYFILRTWQFNVTGWMASAGIVGIAVGFAAKDTMANLFAGLSIIADTPYKLGDYIVLDRGERGRVMRIGLRTTRILTRDGVEITIPNSRMADSQIINESRPLQRQRLHIRIPVAHDADIDKVRGILVDAARSTRKVLADPEPQVRLEEITDAWLKFDVLVWIDDPTGRGAVRDQINTTVLKNFSDAGVSLPRQEIFLKGLSRDADELGLAPVGESRRR
jgi:MscS family membrane protein